MDASIYCGCDISYVMQSIPIVTILRNFPYLKESVDRRPKDAYTSSCSSEHSTMTSPERSDVDRYGPR